MYPTDADEDQGSVLHDAELVLYTADTEWADDAPSNDTLQELELVAWHLWARWEDLEIELPLVGESAWHSWFSVSVDAYSPDPAEPVSEAFIQAVAEMAHHDIAEGYGGITESTWESLDELEQYLVGIIRSDHVETEAPEPFMIIEWCQDRADDLDVEADQ